jgi:hypothetical protein
MPMGHDRPLSGWMLREAEGTRPSAVVILKRNPAPQDHGSRRSAPRRNNADKGIMHAADGACELAQAVPADPPSHWQ